MESFLPATKGGDGAPFSSLTRREREVLEHIAQGSDNAQIAAHLDLSEMTVRNHITSSLFAAIREKLLHGDVSATPESTFGPLAVVSCDQRGTPSTLKALTAYRWFIEHGCQFGSKWENVATLVAPATPNAVLCAAHLKAPLLIVYSPEDEMSGCNPAVTRMTFDAAKGPKESIETTGGHFGLLYYPSPLLDQASRAQREFLLRHL